MFPSFRKAACCVALIGSAWLASSAWALDADEIVRHARDRADGRSFVSKVTLSIYDKQNRLRQREFVYLQKDYAEGDRFAIYFTAPADSRDVAFLIENPRETLDKEDAQWMYLPVSRQTRRISTSDKRGSFMGSEYTYADLDKVRAQDYRQKLIGEETVLDRPCHVIEREPAGPETLNKTGYNKLQVWIDKKSFVVMRQDYFDVKGVLIKQLRATKVESVDGIDSILLSVMQHFVEGTRSEMRFDQLKYNVDLDDQLFTQGMLRRGLKATDLPVNLQAKP